MAIYLKIALRNIWRNKGRSLITLSAIVFGYISIVVAGGFIEDVFYQMRESYIHSFLGHIQVSKKGFYEKGASRPFEFMIDHPRRMMERILNLPHVRSVTPRLEFAGLLSNGENTISFMGQGVDPEGEKRVSSFLTIEDGRSLEPGDRYAVILGRGLAKAMGVRPGDPLIILTNTVDGAINGMDVEVKGVFYTSSKAFDDRTLRMPIETAQKLLQTEKVQTLVILLDDTRNTDLVLHQLRSWFRQEDLPLEARPWYNMADFYNKTVTLFNRQFFVLKLIIAIIVVLSIFNTMNMAVLERIGEIGTIRALGTKRRGVVMLFLAEGVIMGLIGGVAGAIAGYGSARLISYFGIPMPPPPGATIEWVATIRVVPEVFLFAFSLSLITALISSVYPAYKASRLKISEALRHNV